MPLLKRITTVPNSPLRVLVDATQGDGNVGMTMGGTFFFMPAGQEGDQAEVTQHAAEQIMADWGLARHFECIPALSGGGGQAAPTQPAAEPAEQPQVGRRKRRGTRHTEPEPIDG